MAGAFVALVIIGAIVGGEDRAETPYSREEARAIIDAYTSSTAAEVPAPPVTTPTAPSAGERAATRRARAEAARRQRAAAARQERVAAAREKARARARARARAQEAARRERALRGTLVEGYGAKVVAVDLTDDGPLVVETSHSGGANYIVQLVGNGLDELLVNEIGSFSGTVMAQNVLSGRYRMSVQADGSWSLRYRQPRPQGGEQSLLRSFEGSGSEVVPVQTAEDLEPIVTGRNTGGSNFIAYLVGYGDEVSGAELLFNEIGPYSGQTLTTVPSGDYLLSVVAEGPWTIRFER